MGSGKTSWVVQEILNKNYNKNILYITPYLDEIDRIKSMTMRKILSPVNKGNGKLDNIANLLSNQMDIASTHALFRRFDEQCKKALEENKYMLVLDETLTAVEPYQFTKKDDFTYLLNNKDISVRDDGLIQWTGDKLNTRFDDVRILAENQCLFKVNDKFFLWHFPHEIFKLFENVFVLTYLFQGSLMKYYFDLYDIHYEYKSIKNNSGSYKLTDYFTPDISKYRNRIKVYEGKLNSNISQKENILSATWSRSKYNKPEMQKIKNNFYNFCRNIVKADSGSTIWTCYKDCKKELSVKGYAKGFVPCNCRATNIYKDVTCLIYGVNWYENPEIKNFFQNKGITIDESKIALASMLQWIWRSNIRVPDSSKTIYIYIPSIRMRRILTDWLNS